MAAAEADLTIKVVGDTTDAQRKLEGIGSATDGLGGRLGALKGVAVAGLGAIVAGGAAAGKALYDLGGAWDSVEDGLRVGTGATGEALERMVSGVKEIAATTPASIETIGEVMGTLQTRTGATGEALDSLTGKTVKLQQLTGSKNLEAMTGSLKAWGINAEQSAAKTDVLYRVWQATGADVDKLTSVLGSNSETLRQLGFGYDEAAAFIGALDKAGIDASGSMASLSKGLAAAAKEGKNPAKVFDETTSKIKDLLAQGKEAQAVNLAAKLFGTKGASRFVQAVRAGAIGAGDMMKAIGATGDTVDKATEDTADAAEKWQIMVNKIQIALEPLGRIVFGAVADAVDALSKLDIEKVVGSIFGGDAVAKAAGALDGIKQAWPAIAGAITQSVARVMPIVRGFVDLVTSVVSAANDVANAFGGWGAIIGAVTGVLGPIADAVGAILSGVIGVVRGLVDTVAGILTGDWGRVWRGAGGVVSGLWQAVSGAVGGILQSIGGLVAGVAGLLGRWVANSISAAVRFGAGIGQQVRSAMSAVAAAISSGIQSAVQWFAGLPGRVVSALSGFAGRLREVGRNVMDGFIGGVKAMAGRVLSAVTDPIGSAVDKAKRLLGIHSPSRVMRAMGQDTGEGFALGLADKYRRVLSASTALYSAPLKARRPALTTATPAVAAAASPLTINVTGALDPVAVAEQIRTLLDGYHIRYE